MEIDDPPRRTFRSLSLYPVKHAIGNKQLSSLTELLDAYLSIPIIAVGSARRSVDSIYEGEATSLSLQL